MNILKKFKAWRDRRFREKENVGEFPRVIQIQNNELKAVKPLTTVAFKPLNEE